MLIDKAIGYALDTMVNRTELCDDFINNNQREFLMDTSNSQTSDSACQRLVRIDVHGQVRVDEDTNAAHSPAVACSEEQFFSGVVGGVQGVVSSRVVRLHSDTDGLPADKSDFDRAIEQLVKDDRVPSYLKTISVANRNNELMTENCALKAEIEELKSALASNREKLPLRPTLLRNSRHMKTSNVDEL
ncbi:unnamed protein product [Heligmosomoides polygyrus]|uniref:GIT_CC domain-containing protein n=1 Tax=Heligmosomoides polygyrus TaxID=6339 RepID=A0A183FY90_HELPZ|nr:unnamed protein product [Heligmosomoides polygyrus]